MKTDAKKLNIVFTAVAVAAVLLAWLSAYAGVGDETVVPSPWETLVRTGKLLGEAAFWRAFGGTLLRTFVSFAFSLLLGAGLALLASVHPYVRAFFTPIVSVLRTVPTMAITLILILWTNYAVAPVLVSLLVLLPLFYASALAAIDEVREEYGVLATNFRVGAAKQVFCMYLPLSAPPVLAQSGSVFSMGLKITVSGEVLAQTARSLGGMMQEAAVVTNVPLLFALTVVCVLTGFALEGVCALVKFLIVRWRR